MSFADEARAATLANFEDHGETITIDPGGTPAAVLAIRVAPSEESEFGTRRATSETVTLRMLAAQVAPAGLASAIVAAGVAITLADGEQRLVQGAPQWGDSLRVTVAVDTRPAA